MHSYNIFRTAAGWVGIVWCRDARRRAWLARVLLPEKRSVLSRTIKRLFPGSVKGQWPRLQKDIGRALKGQKVDFGHIALRRQELSVFQKRVYAYERRLPWGKVISYDRLGVAIGKRSAARAVGQAQAANPFPLVVPCHRVIKSSGEVGRFLGGKTLKIKLLSLEGIACEHKRGKVFVREVHRVK